MWGDWTPDTQHWTDGIGSTLSVTYTHSAGHCMPSRTGPRRGHTQELSEPAETVGDRLCSNRRMKDPFILMGGHNWLIWITSQASRQMKLVRLNRWSVAVWLVRELGGWGTFPTGGGVYLVKVSSFMVRPLGPCETQRRQGSTWNFTPYNILDRGWWLQQREVVGDTVRWHGI